MYNNTFMNETLPARTFQPTLINYICHHILLFINSCYLM